MFNKVLSKFLPKKTIGSIVADIAKKVEDLKDLAAKHHAKSLYHTSQVSVHNIASQEQTSLRDKAESIAAKLGALIQ